MSIKPLHTYGSDALGVIRSLDPVSNSSYSAPALQNYEDAVKLTLSNKKTLAQVEKHIDDYKKGRGYLSSDIGAFIKATDINNGSQLSAKDGLLYGSIRSFAGYQGYASLVDATEKVIKTVSIIESAPKDAEKAVSKIKEAFS